MSAAGIAERRGQTTEPARLKFAAALVAATAIVALYVGRPVFMPLSLAVLIAFALAPVAAGLRKLKLGPMTSVAATVGLAFAIVASIALFLAGQFSELAATVPAHHAASKLPILQSMNEPMPIWIATSLVEPLLNPLTSAGIAVLFAAFLLVHKDILADRFARFAAASDGCARDALVTAAGREFGRHLLSQGLLDLSFGAAIAVGLWAIGVPNFGLWALLGVMLRSVPFVGVPVAAVCPLMLADSLDPSALLVCKTLVLFLGVDGAAQLVERKLLHRSVARLSAVAAVGATIAWTCLWGLTGLLLAMPLTLGLVLLGRHFEPLRFLDKFLAVSSRDRAETTPAWFPFGRRDAALERSDAAMRALAEAQREMSASVSDRESHVKFRQVIDGTVSRLAPAILPPADRKALALRPWNLAAHWQHDPVLCVAGPGIMDEAAAALLAEALRRKGLKSRIVAFEDTTPANLPRLDVSGVQVVCVSCLDSRDRETMRRLVRRLRPRARNASMIAGLWGWDGGALMDAGTVECDLVTTHLHEAAERIVRLAREASDMQAAPAAAPDFVPVALAA